MSPWQVFTGRDSFPRYAESLTPPTPPSQLLHSKPKDERSSCGLDSERERHREVSDPCPVQVMPGRAGNAPLTLLTWEMGLSALTGQNSLLAAGKRGLTSLLQIKSCIIDQSAQTPAAEGEAKPVISPPCSPPPSPTSSLPHLFPKSISLLNLKDGVCLPALPL